MKILVVEDNEAERLIMQEAFKEANVQHDVQMVNNGVEVLDLLQGKGDFQSDPDLIILDLNMPGKNGLEVLSEIKSSSKWKHIPVLIFSNSEYSGDICRCYTLGVNAYLNKPADFQGFVDLARMIDVFWFKLVRYCVH
jgi:chemotaxis family two-component system response regulator Rcp1